MSLLDRFRRETSIDGPAAARATDRGEVVLIDVRCKQEFASGHAPTARNVPLAGLASQLDALGAKGKPVAFICRARAAHELPVSRALPDWMRATYAAA